LDQKIAQLTEERNQKAKDGTLPIKKLDMDKGANYIRIAVEYLQKNHYSHKELEEYCSKEGRSIPKDLFAQCDQEFLTKYPQYFADSDDDKPKEIRIKEWRQNLTSLRFKHIIRKFNLKQGSQDPSPGAAPIFYNEGLAVLASAASSAAECVLEASITDGTPSKVNNHSSDIDQLLRAMDLRPESTECNDGGPGEASESHDRGDGYDPGKDSSGSAAGDRPRTTADAGRGARLCRQFMQSMENRYYEVGELVASSDEEKEPSKRGASSGTGGRRAAGGRRAGAAGFGGDPGKDSRGSAAGERPRQTGAGACAGASLRQKEPPTRPSSGTGGRRAGAASRGADGGGLESIGKEGGGLGGAQASRTGGELTVTSPLPDPSDCGMRRSAEAGILSPHRLMPALAAGQPSSPSIDKSNLLYAAKRKSWAMAAQKGWTDLASRVRKKASNQRAAAWSRGDGSILAEDQETIPVASAVATESGGERPFTPLGARADWPGSRHFVATSTDVGPCCRSPGTRCPSPRCRGLRVPPPRRR
jgi:hypothetical protein